MTRHRFTAPASLIAEAEEYAKQDGRTLSTLICEALRQHMKRYPKNGATERRTSLEKRVCELEAIIAGRVPAGTYKANPKASVPPIQGFGGGVPSP